MASPETGNPDAHWNHTKKMWTGAALFATVVAIAAPTPTREAHSQASPGEIDAADIERCKEENPPRPSTLTLNDYLNVER